jgi:hypothetical protein
MQAELKFYYNKASGLQKTEVFQPWNGDLKKRHKTGGFPNLKQGFKKNQAKSRDFSNPETEVFQIAQPTRALLKKNWQNE